MEKIDFTNPDYEFDDIAEQVFYPIYDVIAQDLLEETGIVSGSMLDVGCGGGHLGFAVMAKSDLTGAFVDINATAVGWQRRGRNGWESGSAAGFTGRTWSRCPLRTGPLTW